MQKWNEIISKKSSDQRKEQLKKLWKEECVREEIRSRVRWENSNVKWTETYETEFLKFFETKSPFICDETFLPPNIRNQKHDQQQQQDNGDNNKINGV